jgi:hypothetical protein
MRHRKKGHSLQQAKNGGIPPRGARLLMGVISPKGFEEEFLEAFDDLYATFAIKEYGNWAPAWAWMQVMKTVITLVRDTILTYAGRRAE